MGEIGVMSEFSLDSTSDILLTGPLAGWEIRPVEVKIPVWSTVRHLDLTGSRF